MWRGRRDEMTPFVRRNWLRYLIYGGMACCAAEGFLIEPHWIRIDRLSLGKSPSVRVVHISDIHFKGDSAYLSRIVDKVNQLSPDIVCFPGDIVEDTRYLEEALTALGRIKVPLYGVPGNHEYWSGASFERIGECFRRTGGDWLVDQSAVTLGGKVLIVGSSGAEVSTQRTASEFAMPGRRTDWSPASAFAPGASRHGQVLTPPPVPGAKRILLTHYPAVVDSIRGEAYDLILSGHAHGGQVRLPFFGALLVPYGVQGYQLGTYMTPAGLLHVSSGLGTFFLPVRFGCRPDITAIEL